MDKFVRQLTERDNEIVEHTIRHRLATNETIQVSFFADQTPNAVTKVTARLCERGYLKKFPLVHPRSYFLPGRRAVQEFGVPLARTYPLGPQSLPREYAVLAYCTSSRGQVMRLTAKELRNEFPTFPDRWTEMPHCLRSRATSPVLELIRVDLGGSADHVFRKCVSDYSRRLRLSATRKLIDKSRFRLVIITGTTEKQAAITEALQKHTWPEGLTIHMVAVPDLLPLLPNCTPNGFPTDVATKSESPFEEED